MARRNEETTACFMPVLQIFAERQSLNTDRGCSNRGSQVPGPPLVALKQDNKLQQYRDLKGMQELQWARKKQKSVTDTLSFYTELS